MSKGDVYKQVKMQRENLIDTAFIPQALAKVGKKLKIKKEDGWENGWVVLEVYSQKMVQELDTDRRTQKEWMTSHDA